MLERRLSTVGWSQHVVSNVGHTRVLSGWPGLGHDFPRPHCSHQRLSMLLLLPMLHVTTAGGPSKEDGGHAGVLGKAEGGTRARAR